MLAEQPQWIQNLDGMHLLTPLRVLLVIVAAALVTVVVRVLIKRVLRRTLGLPGADRGRAEARQRALATSLRGAIVGVVWGTTAIIVISEAGINIGAFVATATVVGGAVAFGAQTLIRDVISGFFVLAEDQYGVGDEIDLGHASGTVERITLRSVRLRDGTGGVWHVPHGGVVRVGNMSKSSVALLDLEVARASPLPALDSTAAQLCAALAQHPEAAGRLAGEPAAVGISDVRDDRLVYRLSVPTGPGHHDVVQRLWRLLALQAFERGELLPPAVPFTLVKVHPDDAAAERAQHAEPTA
ncbi:MAG: mechanosensitive ion channel [Actinomycetota bacterium]|nr:mechanosensitive ion channel [Actinomycetota bacterium]